MKKNVFCLIILITLSLCLTGCFDSKETKKIKSQASENALDYIKEKYGISAKVISVIVEKLPTGTFTTEKSGFAYVNCKYESKKFQVYISGKDETNEGLDNYQKDEIINDINDYFTGKTNFKSHHNDIYYGKNEYDHKYYGLIKELYNKNNLIEIINNNDTNILIEYIEQGNLEFIKNNNLFNELKARVILVNYYSKDAYNNSTHKYSFTDIDDDFIMNALNIESAYTLDIESKYYKFDVNSIDNMHYFNDGLETSENLTLSKTTISDVKNWVGHGACKNVKKIYDAYKVENVTNTKNGKLYVYIPEKSLKGYKLKNVSLGIECDGKFLTLNVEKVGKNVVGAMSFYACPNADDLKFTVLYSKC